MPRISPSQRRINSFSIDLISVLPVIPDPDRESRGVLQFPDSRFHGNDNYIDSLFYNVGGGLRARSSPGRGTRPLRNFHSRNGDFFEIMPNKTAKFREMSHFPRRERRFLARISRFTGYIHRFTGRTRRFPCCRRRFPDYIRRFPCCRRRFPGRT